MKKDCLIKIVVGILCAFTIGVGIYNGFVNDTFFAASLTQVLTLLISLCIVFWATQYKNDQRKVKEHAEDIIEKVQILVTREDFFVFSALGDKEETKKKIMANNRKISNCINVMQQYSKTLGFEDDVKYIENEFKEYKEMVSEHIEDLDYLSKTESRFRKFSENIDSKCDVIILSLYK